MRNATLPTFLAIAITFAMTCSLHAEIKVFTVDMNKLFAEYHVTKNNMATLKAEQDAYLKEREERHKSLAEVAEKVQAVIEKLRTKAMPKAEKENVFNEYQELVSQYNALGKDIQESDREKLRNIKAKIAAARREGLNEIQKVVVKYAKDNGYQWVMEQSGLTNTQVSPLMYARNAEDKSDDILAILNKDAPATEEKADKKPADEPAE